ncbi:MAG: helix-turn-helix transcriptional regulator [Clostridia bacterium]|nr:helix-turn-helix transcriptional regulator [Clostridia bacterium]
MKSTENTGCFADRLSDLISKAAQNGITLRDIEKATGVKKESISKYQNNKAEPGLNSIVALAKYFNVSSDYLLGLSDTATTDITIQDICRKTGLSENLITFLLEDNELYSTEHRNLYKLSTEGLITADEERRISRSFLNTLYANEQFSQLCYVFYLLTAQINSALSTDCIANMVKEELFKIRSDELSKNDLIKYKIYEIEQIFINVIHDITKYDELQQKLRNAISIMTTESNYSNWSIADLTYDEFVDEALNKMSHIIEDMLKGEDNGNSN